MSLVVLSRGGDWYTAKRTMGVLQQFQSVVSSENASGVRKLPVWSIVSFWEGVFYGVLLHDQRLLTQR